jgi:3-dehydroquinate synthase
MKMITLTLGKSRHPIWVGPKALDQVGPLMKKNGLTGKVMVVTNPVVGRLYGTRLRKSLAVAGIRSNWFEIPDAETSKSLVWCGRAYRAMAQAEMDRGDCVVALGGGVVGDLGGFLGATYLRGIVTVQIPTSLIAQVDSSVGGKTGINLPEGKNLVGAFCQPDLVVVDPSVLSTLPDREWKSGMAEIVKYGAIAEEAFFHFVESRLERLRKFRPKDLQDAVLMSCRIKTAVVEADEREAGPRAILNFGHTLGHALETLTRYRRYTHGEQLE